VGGGGGVLEIHFSLSHTRPPKSSYWAFLVTLNP
jgi:hypothetical protein